MGSQSQKECCQTQLCTEVQAAADDTASSYSAVVDAPWVPSAATGQYSSEMSRLRCLLLRARLMRPAIAVAGASAVPAAGPEAWCCTNRGSLQPHFCVSAIVHHWCFHRPSHWYAATLK